MERRRERLSSGWRRREGSGRRARMTAGVRLYCSARGENRLDMAGARAAGNAGSGSGGELAARASERARARAHGSRGRERGRSWYENESDGDAGPGWADIVRIAGVVFRGGLDWIGLDGAG